MNLKLRLNKLEAKQPDLSTCPFGPGPIALVGMNLDESEDHACSRWMNDNPGKVLPNNRIYLVPFT